MINQINRVKTVRVRLTVWAVGLLALTLFGFSVYVFFEMRRSLLQQVDNSLQTITLQALGKLTDEEELRFIDQADSPILTSGLTQSGASLRLIDVSGSLLDGVGGYLELPIWVADQAGYITLVQNQSIWRIYSYPLQFRGESVVVWLQVAQSLVSVYDTLDNLSTAFQVILPVIVVVALMGGIFLADRALRPVHAMTTIAKQVSEGQLEARIAYSGVNDELGQLANTLDTMLDKLQSAFETERRFVADASHELRTPLTVIKGHLDVTLTQPRQAEAYIETLEAIREENNRLIRLVNTLLYLAKLDSAPLKQEKQPIQLTELLAIVCEQVKILAEEKHITLTATLTELPSINGNTDHLIRLFLNVLDNAVKYTPEGGTVTVSAHACAKYVHIAIEDSGCGIAPEHLPHLFKRFYRVKENVSSAYGTGLGLAIAHSVVAEHGGKLSVTSQLQQGSIFTVMLPLSG